MTCFDSSLQNRILPVDNEFIYSKVGGFTDRVNLTSGFKKYFSYTVQGRSFDLNGLMISSLFSLGELEKWTSTVFFRSKFGANSRFSNDPKIKGFELTSTASSDFFFFQERACAGDDEFNGVCNNVPVLTPEFITPSKQGKLPAKFRLRYNNYTNTINEIVSKGSSDLPGFVFIGQGDGKYAVARLNHNNEVLFYIVDNGAELEALPNSYSLGVDAAGKDNTNFRYLGKGNWSKLKIDGTDVISIELSSALKRVNPNLPNRMALFIHAGSLRHGRFFAKGDVISEDQVHVNYKAHQEVLKAIGN